MPAITVREQGLLTTGEAAERVPCSTQTIRNWIATGLLPAIRIGRKSIFIYEEDLDKVRQPVCANDPQDRTPDRDASPKSGGPPPSSYAVPPSPATSSPAA